MCLAVPVRVLSIIGNRGKGEVGGAQVEFNTGFIRGLKPGEYILLHAGFAIQKVDAAEAEKTLKLFEELNEGLN